MCVPGKVQRRDQPLIAAACVPARGMRARCRQEGADRSGKAKPKNRHPERLQRPPLFVLSIRPRPGHGIAGGISTFMRRKWSESLLVPGERRTLVY